MRYEWDPPFVYLSSHEHPFNLIRYVEYVLPQFMGDHFPYNPRHLPVVLHDEKKEDYLLTLSVMRIMRGYRVRSSSTTSSQGERT